MPTFKNHIDNPQANPKKTALLLSGGAPNATMMAGALLALLEKGVRFPVVSTSGAGALIGLLATAPKGRTWQEALSSTPDFGVSDWINKVFPVNYKVFQKPGVLADAYRTMTNSFPPYAALLNYQPKNDLDRFMKDAAILWVNTLCPSDLNAKSLGMCANVPFVEQVVDFDALSKSSTKFYINAYNITQRKMANWGNAKITPQTFHAAFAFPFIYPPVEIDGDMYYEGASVDAVNYEALMQNHSDLETLVVFDVLGKDKYITEPRDLYDSWVKSIIVPLVEVARDDTKLYELKHKPKKQNLLKVQFDVPADELTQMFDWSYSNLERLYQVGRKAGDQFYKDYGFLLPHAPGIAQPKAPAQAKVAAPATVASKPQAAAKPVTKPVAAAPKKAVAKKVAATPTAVSKAVAAAKAVTKAVSKAVAKPAAKTAAKPAAAKPAAAKASKPKAVAKPVAVAPTKAPVLVLASGGKK